MEKIICDGLVLYRFDAPFYTWRGEKYIEYGTKEDLKTGYPTYRFKEYQLHELIKLERLKIIS